MHLAGGPTGHAGQRSHPAKKKKIRNGIYTVNIFNKTLKRIQSQGSVHGSMVKPLAFIEYYNKDDAVQGRY